MTRLSFLLAAFLLLTASVEAASFRTEVAQEEMVRAIAVKLRCPVCQSENILDSQSGTAKEMMTILREQLAEGRSEAEIVEFFRSRYGDYVMLSPPALGYGGLVWAAPLLLLLADSGVYLLLLRRSTRASSALHAAAPERSPLTEQHLKGLEL
jgi:cytochrome c-type biogenesis protein CcmH